jgi:single-strand DNA-binding protein
MYQEITVIGYVGNDAEMRYTPSGVPVTSFSLAANETWKGQDGEKHEKTTWFRVTMWRKQAEAAAQWITKGKLLMVKGTVEARAYLNKSGEPAASLELTANFWKFMGGKNDRDTGYDEGRDDAGAAAAGIGSEEDLDAPF